MLPDRTNNPNWPLPSDYWDLEPDGQQQARINAVSSWYDPDRPYQLIADPEAFVVGFKFFKLWYRMGWVGNKAKYGDEIPQMHWDWVDLMARNPLLGLTCFRGSGKTMLFGEEIPEFCIVTRPHTPVQYTSSTEPLTDKQIRAVRFDIETNELIRRDWPELVPGSGSSLIWRGDAFELTNGSSFYGISAESAQRGATQNSLRSLLQCLDDWEKDSDMDNENARNRNRHFLLNVFFPCADPRAQRVWTNTLIDERALSWQMIRQTEDIFKPWTCVGKYQNIWHVGTDGKYHSWWPGRFSEDRIRTMMGTTTVKGQIAYDAESFASEFMNDPTARKKPAFCWNEDLHGYEWRGSEDEPIIVPRRTNNCKILLKELQATAKCVIAVDFSLGATKESDLSCIAVSYFVPGDNMMIIAETWIDRLPPSEIMKLVYKKGEFWGATVLVLEQTVFEKVLNDQVAGELDARRANGQYAPALHIIKRPGGPSKGTRMLGLSWRFSDGKILVPVGGSLTTDWGRGSPEFIDQLKALRADGTSRNFDDAVDAVEMTQAGAGAAYAPPVARKEEPLEKIQAAMNRGVRIAVPEEIPGNLYEMLNRATFSGPASIIYDPD